MKAKDLREKSTEDLNELLKTTARGSFETRFKNFTNRLDNTSEIRKTRREVARIRTILGERARGAAATSPAAKPAKAKAPKAALKSETATETKPAAKKTKKGEAK
jgi:large subunit ribosomal protein L29